MSAYADALIKRIAANTAVIWIPVAIFVLDTVSKGQRLDGKAIVAVLAAAVLTAVKNYQSHLDLIAPAK